MLKTILPLVLALLFTSSALAQGLVPREILSRVYQIQYEGFTASSFQVNIDKNIYLVTAKHLFKPTVKSKDEVGIAILNSGRWSVGKVKVLFHEDPTLDIALLDIKLRSDSTGNLYAIGGSSSFFLSQECFFLGFPYGNGMDDQVDKPINGGFPIPFVKRAIVSSMTYSASSNGSSKLSQIILDGINNAGFSGGPVIVINQDPKAAKKVTVIGVVNSYRVDEQTAKIPSTGEEVKLRLNSGLVNSTSIEYIYEILKQN